MYHSLQDHGLTFHLYVVAFDHITYQYFQDHPLENLTVISLTEFEDEKLLSVKSTRSPSEYCWTCTASTVLYAITTYKLDHCVYVDADMRFYANPQPLFDEWGNKSVLITEHRYTPAYDQSILSGKYCVQFVGFKNDKDGIEAVTWWRNACIDWCYARAEDGKFGDQKYLDDWTIRFKNVHVLEHLGGGLAPWNMQQYVFRKEQHKIIGREKATGKEFNAIFFHFHGLKIYKDDISSLTGETYEMNRSAWMYFYQPYVKSLLLISEEVHKRTGGSFNSNGVSEDSPDKPLNFLSLIRWYFYDIRQDIKNIGGKATNNRMKHYHYRKF